MMVKFTFVILMKNLSFNKDIYQNIMSKATLNKKK